MWTAVFFNYSQLISKRASITIFLSYLKSNSYDIYFRFFGAILPILV